MNVAKEDEEEGDDENEEIPGGYTNANVHYYMVSSIHPSPHRAF
jgi:hypothetical protein